MNTHTPTYYYDGLPASIERARVLKTRGRPKSDAPPHLTSRQAALVQALAEGSTMKEAAWKLGITLGSAKNYLRWARCALGIRTTYHLVALYAQGKLLVGTP